MKTNVQIGIIGSQMVEPIFFDDNLTGEKYQQFLLHKLVPPLCALYPIQLDPDLPDERIRMKQNQMDATTLFLWRTSVFERNFSKYMDRQKRCN